MDLRKALNAVSDVVANRPPAIREFDQIYMKHADLLIQSELISKWFADRDVVFIGDGDAIALCLTHLKDIGEFKNGPNKILVLDFDERVVNSVLSFAQKYNLNHKIAAKLYNVADPLPRDLWAKFNAFYTNPPFGATNNGVSIKAFIKRGLEACEDDCIGCVVLADSSEQDSPWLDDVLYKVQCFILEEEKCIISEMVPRLHTYHLDDDPSLTSCSLILKRIGQTQKFYNSTPIDEEIKKNFYGAGKHLEVRYVRDTRIRIKPGVLISTEYKLEMW